MRGPSPARTAPLAVKLGKGEPIGASAEEGYMPNGVRVNFFEKERGSKRAVDMLLKKLADKPFVTEFPMPDFDRVEPNPAVKDLHFTAWFRRNSSLEEVIDILKKTQKINVELKGKTLTVREA